MADKSPRLRKGQVVAVEFEDHVEDGSQPELFVVYGEVSEVSRKFVCIDSWAYKDQKLDYDINEKRFTIVRSAISRIVWLEAGQTWMPPQRKSRSRKPVSSEPPKEESAPIPEAVK